MSTALSLRFAAVFCVPMDEDVPFQPVPATWFNDNENFGSVENSGEDAESDTLEHVGLEQEASDGQIKYEIYGAPSPPNDIHSPVTAAVPLSSPSWRELSLNVLPIAAKELLSTSLQRISYSARVSYSFSRRRHKYTELGNNSTGFLLDHEGSAETVLSDDTHRCKTLEAWELQSKHLDKFAQLPCFSSLSWVERQLVKEWRTYQHGETAIAHSVLNLNASTEACDASGTDEDDVEFARARRLLPVSAPRPTWQHADFCFTCRKVFGPTRLRHHCRLCGRSFCRSHSAYTHALPHLGYDPSVPERVCDSCKTTLLELNMAERVAWRLARCRDYQLGTMQPYFDTGQDTVEQMLLRITEAALAVGRCVPLGAQAAIAVETLDVLRKYGLSGIYTIMLRQEFLAAADLLRKALGINQTAWPLSVHELSAAIFYALAQHRAMRGMNPEREHLSHALRDSKEMSSVHRCNDEPGVRKGSGEDEDMYSGGAKISDLISGSSTDINVEDVEASKVVSPAETFPCRAVCDPVSDETLASLIFYAPIALNFIYATKEVDMQLLAAQQGWRLVYAYMEQESGHKDSERPASALFVHEEQKIACVAVRGTATIHDVITDIRQTPVPFPDEDDVSTGKADGDWTRIVRGRGLAVCGMAGAAMNLYREHIDSILCFAHQGYRIRLTGHSLGGGVAALLGALVYRDLEQESNLSKESLRVYSYGTPSCVDAKLAETVEPFVTTVILHDDVIPRLTPESCRNLLKHLLNIRETWVKEHFLEDFMAIHERAKTVWAPTFRNSFTLKKSLIKTYCQKKYESSKFALVSVRGAIRNEMVGYSGHEPNHAIKTNIEEPEQVASTETRKGNIDVGNTINEDEEPPKLLLDYMGGIDNRSPGLVIDGDEFFDPFDELIESATENNAGYDVAVTDFARWADPKVQEQCDAQYSAAVDSEIVDNALNRSKEYEADFENENPGAVVIEETPLPRMYIPGKIIHIYTHRGVYRCTYVPRAFKELRRISMAGNMLTDHKATPYYEALLELRTVRQSPEYPPRWTAFDEDDTCSCCASRFTWASTSSSEAQEARDKHNCRSCGTLVCDPCSKHRSALPSIGLNALSRVCDRCYNDIVGIKSSAMTSSFIGLKESCMTPRKITSNETTDGEYKPVRERERRSAVVDELASRVGASPLICS